MKFIFNNDQPIYLQIVEQLRIYIISGKISPGEKLPTVRELADQARANPNTVQRALSILEDEKLILTERTNGKYTTNDTELIEKIRHRLAADNVSKYFAAMSALGFTQEDAIKYLIKEE